MLIVNISKNDNIDKALKVLKSKVIGTRQQKILFERKEFTKKSIVRRNQILSAIHREKKSKGIE